MMNIVADTESSPVRLVHHPFSHRTEEQVSLAEYHQRLAQPSTYVPSSASQENWYSPFGSEADFDFSEFVTELS